MSPWPTGGGDALEALAGTSDDLDEYVPPATSATNGSTPSASLAPVGGGGAGGARVHFAMPRLLGAPAYARPPRVVSADPRPFDPDDLPLEAFRTEEDRARLAAMRAQEAAAQRAAADRAAGRPSATGGLRSMASRLLRTIG